MTKEHLPTVNYLDWLDAFQQRVSEMQEKVQRMDRYFQGPYRDITELFRSLNLKSDIEVIVTQYGVSISWLGVTDDCRALLEDVRGKITARLEDHGLIRPGSNGSIREGYSWECRWRLFDKDAEVGGIGLTYYLPTDGNRDMVREAKTVTRTYEDTIFNIAERPMRQLGWKEAEESNSPNW